MQILLKSVHKGVLFSALMGMGPIKTSIDVSMMGKWGSGGAKFLITILGEWKF